MMGDLKQLRKRIDEIDEQILQALSERIKICKAIGATKKEQKMPIKDADRENEVYKRTREKALQLSLNPEQVEEMYREIVNMCSAVQEVKEKQK
jgi:chorismate mutase